MNLAVDVQYEGDERAMAAGVTFPEWTAATIVSTALLAIGTVAPYRPGAFYERELPCILALLDTLDIRPATIVIDGYVALGGEGRDGLGAHLHAALGGAVPVVGIAKSRFAGTPADTEVFRGTSRRPLYVTSRGIAADEARRLVAAMHGPHRVPTVVAAVDRACRDALTSSADTPS